MPIDNPNPPTHPVTIQAPDQEHWPKIEALFERAIKVPTDERGTLLDQSCEDEAIRQSVERLLAADERAEGFMETRASDSAETPLQIGPYPVQGELGRGGMGVVYLARDPELDRPVALKCVSRDRGNMIERLVREAKILASLDHPNIATIYRLERIDGESYLILEYIEGMSLEQKLLKDPPNLRESLRIAAAIAAGLSAAHDEGIVHRDLKPANVRITSKGRVKVLDFGLAKPFALGKEEEAEQGLTRQGTVLGTVSYMSPEQATGQSLDQRTDVWAFGCLLFECLSGHRSFARETPWQTLHAIAHEEPDWDVLPVLPRALESLLRRCLRKETSERQRDLGDARLELEELLSDISGDFSGAYKRPVASRWGVPLYLRKRSLALFLAVSVIAAGAGFLWDSSSPEASNSAASLRVEAALSNASNIAWNLGVSAIAIAPRGTHIAYWGSEGLYVRALDSFEEVLLPGIVNARSPFFSPDGKWLGYFSGAGLFKIALAGGVPVLLTPKATQGVGATWGDDDSIVFAADWQSGLWRVSASGGKPQRVSVLESESREISHRWPYVLPGSKAVLFTVKTPEITSFDESSIAVLDLESGERRILIEGGTTPMFLPSGYLAYVVQGRLQAVAFDSDTLQMTGTPITLIEGIQSNRATGASSVGISLAGTLFYLPERDDESVASVLVSFDRDGQATRLENTRIPGGRWRMGAIKLSPNRRFFAVVVFAANNSIWIGDLERGTFRPLSRDLGNTGSPLWSPDGSRIVFSMEDGGKRQIASMRADGEGSPKTLLESEVRFIPSAWSPDGQHLLLQTNGPGSGTDLWLVRPDGADLRPFLQTRFAESGPSFSPDGSWLAYNSNETGRTEVFVRSFPGPGASRQVSSGGGAGPTWSPSGRELFYHNLNEMMVADFDPGPDPEISVGRRLFDVGFSFGSFAFDGRQFLVPEPRLTSSPVRSLRLVFDFSDEIETAFSNAGQSPKGG